MRKFFFSLLLAAILTVVTTVIPVFAGGPDGLVPCCH
jgi:hypothetical protein